MLFDTVRVYLLSVYNLHTYYFILFISGVLYRLYNFCIIMFTYDYTT